jgi:hypothetical protein
VAESLSSTALAAALIHNPRSHRNRSIQLSIPPELPSAVPATTDELRTALAGFAERGTRLLIVSGGDGTLRDILGLLPETFGANWPRIALIAAGNSNSVAIDVGSISPGPNALQRVLLAAKQDRWSREVHRPAITLRWPDGSRDPVFGFFMGAAALTRATQYARENVETGGRWSVITTLIATFYRCIFGGSDWLNGSQMSIAYDDRPALEGRRFLFVSTSLHTIMLHIWPFWNDGDGPLRYVEIDAHPRRLGRSLFPLLFGRPTKWMRSAGSGYRSGAATRMRLQLDSPLIVDGEAFAPDRDGRVDVEAGPVVHFVSP